MSITYSQVPPVYDAILRFGVDYGDIIFFEESPMVAYRSGRYLVMECEKISMAKRVESDDETVDVYLHAFAELVEETIPRLADK